MERRSFEFRVESDGRISGVVIPYGSDGVVRNFRERFAPGSVRFDDVLLNHQHDRARPLARTNGGGLVLQDGPTELRASVVLPETTAGRDVRTLVQSRVLRAFSAEFTALRDSWQGNLRTIHAAVLHGIGIVDTGAYAGATIDEIREWSPFACTEERRLAPWPYL